MGGFERDIEFRLLVITQSDADKKKKYADTFFYNNCRNSFLSGFVSAAGALLLAVSHEPWNDCAGLFYGHCIRNRETA